MAVHVSFHDVKSIELDTIRVNERNGNASDTFTSRVLWIKFADDSLQMFQLHGATEKNLMLPSEQQKQECEKCPTT